LPNANSTHGRPVPTRARSRDDLSIEIIIGVQPVGQANANHEDAEDAETGEPQESQWQHPKQAEKKDRQQRQ
jgi:hypothetical protein